MNKLFYPAIFHDAEEGGYWVTFPDFPGCFTQGETTEEAYLMAQDALGLALEDYLPDKRGLPTPSAATDIEVEKNASIIVIQFDYEEYLKRHCSKAVKKTLTIPQWLNEEATAMGVNFSQVLQEALLQKIRLK